MNATDFISAGVAFVIATAVAHVLLSLTGLNIVGTSFFLGSAAALAIIAWRFERRGRVPPTGVENKLGILLATSTLVTGLLLQLTLEWLSSPVLTTLLCAIIAYFVPHFVWGTIWKAVEEERARRRAA